MIVNIEVNPYKPKIHFMKISDKMPHAGKDKSIQYELGITPQLKDEPNWCIFMCTVFKQTISIPQGINVIDCKVTYGYKMNVLGHLITPQFLYELLLLSYIDFVRIFNEYSKGKKILIPYHLDKPEYKDYENSLKIAIIGQGTSKQ